LTSPLPLGLFDQPYTDPSLAKKVISSPAFEKLALRAARQSMNLLKNDDATLPLDASRLKRVAVVGPNADAPRCGDYTAGGGCGGGNVNNRNVGSVLRELKAALPDAVITHAAGTSITGALPSYSTVQQHHYGANGLKAAYFNNTALAGAPVVQRADPAINFHWFLGGPCGVAFGMDCPPGLAVGFGSFSARWTGNISADSSAVHASLQLALDGGAGHGARLWVDGRLLIDAWSTTAQLNVSFPLVQFASHAIVVEYWKGPSPGLSFALEWDVVGGSDDEAAVQAACEGADFTIVVLGDSQRTLGEGVDRGSLSLPGRQVGKKIVHSLTMSS
jgi:beta-glucosidase